MIVHHQVIRQLILENLKVAHRGVSHVDLMMRVYSKTSTAVNAKEVSIVMTQLLNEGEIIKLDYKPGGSPMVETIFFIKGTEFLNLEEVIANQQSLKRSSRLGEESTGD